MFPLRTARTRRDPALTGNTGNSRPSSAIFRSIFTFAFLCLLWFRARRRIGPAGSSPDEVAQEGGEVVRALVGGEATGPVVFRETRRRHGGRGAPRLGDEAVVAIGEDRGALRDRRQHRGMIV